MFGAVLTLVLLLVAATPARAADPGILGSWNCTSSTADGDDSTWTLTISQQDGKLVGTVADSSVGDITVTDLKAEGDEATFTAGHDGATFAVKLTVKGSALEGTFEVARSLPHGHVAAVLGTLTLAARVVATDSTQNSLIDYTWHLGAGFPLGLISLLFLIAGCALLHRPLRRPDAPFVPGYPPVRETPPDPDPAAS